MLRELAQRFNANEWHVACDRNHVAVMLLHGIAKRSAEAAKRPRARWLVRNTRNAFRQPLVGRRITDEHHIEADLAPERNEMLEDGRAASRRFEKPFGCAHAARLPANEDR